MVAPCSLIRLHLAPQVAPRLRIEPGGGLVEKQDLRLVDQRHRQQQALLLPAGKFARILVEKFVQR